MPSVKKSNNSTLRLHGRRYLNALLLCVLLFIIAPKLYDLHQGSHSTYDKRAHVQWSQPESLDTKYWPPITNQSWRLEFSEIERLLWNTYPLSSNELTIDADTLDLLEQINALLPQNLSTQESARLSLLIRRSLPGDRGEQLAVLQHKYNQYQLDHSVSVSSINQGTPEQQLQKLKSSLSSLRPRQYRFFGAELATKLFTDKNTTITYLTRRRIISLSEHLSSAQKAQRLAALKADYKAFLKPKSNE